MLGSETETKWPQRALLTASLAVLSLLLMLVLPQAQAFASGGADIASAPPISYGKQLFGSTATDGHGEDSFGCGVGLSWWLLPVLAGDEVTIDVEGALNQLDAMTVGTTDYNLHSSSVFTYAEVGSSDKQELSFTAPVGGAMPLEFFTACGDSWRQPGPYDFTATDHHAVVAALKRYPHIKTTTPLVGTASLADGTPVPDGMAFTLTVSWSNHSHAQYSATSVGGVLTFPLSLPATAQGKKATFVVTRPADGQYQAAKGDKMEVVVARPRVLAPPAHRHHRHRRHRHPHHR